MITLLASNLESFYTDGGQDIYWTYEDASEILKLTSLVGQTLTATSVIPAHLRQLEIQVSTSDIDELILKIQKRAKNLYKGIWHA